MFIPHPGAATDSFSITLAVVIKRAVSAGSIGIDATFESQGHLLAVRRRYSESALQKLAISAEREGSDSLRNKAYSWLDAE